MLKAMLKNEYLISCIKKFNTVFWGMISIILLNRYLGPELKGEYAYVTNLLSILMVILGFGISTIYPVYKRKDDKKYFRIFVKLVIIQFITYISLGLILCTISTDFNLRVLAILTPICVLASEIGYINLVEEFKFNAIVAIISAFINAILFVFAYIFLDKNLIVAYVIYAIKELLIIILTLISIKKRKVEKVKVEHPIKEYKAIILSGIVPMITNLLIVINYRVDVLMLTWQNIDSYLIGLYSVGVSIAEYAWIVPDIFKEVIINKTARNDSIEDVKFSLRISSTFLIIVFLIMFFFGKLILQILFGAEYVDAYYVTVIIFTGIYSMTYCKIIGTLFIAKGKQKFYCNTLLVGTISNIIINYVVIPRWNIYGAAIATVISYTIVGGVFIFEFKRLYKNKLRDILCVKREDFSIISKRIKQILSKNDLKNSNYQKY